MAADFQDAVGYLGNFQFRGNLLRDAPEISLRFQLGYEISKIPVFHLPDLDTVEPALDARLDQHFAEQEGQQDQHHRQAGDKLQVRL